MPARDLSSSVSSCSTPLASAGPGTDGTTTGGCSSGHCPAASSDAHVARNRRAAVVCANAWATFQSSSPPGARSSRSGSARSTRSSSSPTASCWARMPGTTALLDARANLAPQCLEPGQAPVRDDARRRRRRAPRPRGASAMERGRWSSRAALARGARSAPPAGRRPWRRRPPLRPGRACRTRRAP